MTFATGRSHSRVARGAAIARSCRGLPHFLFWGVPAAAAAGLPAILPGAPPVPRCVFQHRERATAHLASLLRTVLFRGSLSLHRHQATRSRRVRRGCTLYRFICPTLFFILLPTVKKNSLHYETTKTQRPTRIIKVSQSFRLRFT
jgi:hypothetical protein